MLKKGVEATSGGPRLRALDALRGLCALFVALLHVRALSHLGQFSIVQGSWLFVDFFFVLSGFVIAYVYLDRIRTGATFIAFVIRRFGRLWPLHAFVLLLYIVSEAGKLGMHEAGLAVHTQPFTGPTTIDTIIANLLLVHSLGLYSRLGWNIPSWSISVEFYTYLIFAGLCIAARRQIAVAASIVIVASVFLLAWSSKYLTASLDLGIFRCAYGFFVGVLTLLAYRAVSSRGWILPWASVLEVGCVVLTAVLVILGRNGGAVTLLAPVVFAAAVFIFAQEAGALSRLLCSDPFGWLGDRSYAVYMIHAFLGDATIRILLLASAFFPIKFVKYAPVEGVSAVVSFDNPFVTDLAVLFYVLAVLVCAHLVHLFVERPSRSFFNRCASTYLRRQSIAPAGAPT